MATQQSTNRTKPTRTSPITWTERQLFNFWRRVHRPEADTCWEWRGLLNHGGYGHYAVLGRTYIPHRVSYELIVGPIPDGLQIDHLCRNKVCVNPKHLEAVTQQENIRRSDCPPAKRGRMTHCALGHEITRDRSGVRRTCVPCQRRRQRERRKAESKLRALLGPAWRERETNLCATDAGKKPGSRRSTTSASEPPRSPSRHHERGRSKGYAVLSISVRASALQMRRMRRLVLSRHDGLLCRARARNVLPSVRNTRASSR